jgi:hypothetical protein
MRNLVCNVGFVNPLATLGMADSLGLDLGEPDAPGKVQFPALF